MFSITTIFTTKMAKKKWILEIYDASSISDKRVFDIAGIQNCGHLVTNASVYLILN